MPEGGAGGGGWQAGSGRLGRNLKGQLELVLSAEPEGQRPQLHARSEGFSFVGTRSPDRQRRKGPLPTL